MSYTDYAAEAAKHRRTAATATRRAAKWARLAAEAYQTADGYRQHAAWLTRRPDTWDQCPRDYWTPAYWEGYVVTTTANADILLEMSSRDTAEAVYYRQLARRYDRMHDEFQASVAS